MNGLQRSSGCSGEMVIVLADLFETARVCISHAAGKAQAHLRRQDIANKHVRYAIAHCCALQSV